MSDPPTPDEETCTDRLIKRLSGLLGAISLIGTLLAQRFVGPNRDRGPNSFIHYEKLFRMERAVRWTHALMDVLSGRLTFTRPEGRLAPVSPPPARAASPTRRRPPGSRAPYPLGDTMATLRELFTTRSMREVVTRICIDLEITPDMAAWPAELLIIYETPAQWSAAHYLPDPGPCSPRLALHWYSQPKPQLPAPLGADILPPDPAPHRPLPEFHSSA